jgi:hypothetical protein
MPQIENQESPKFTRKTTLDREQLEYTFQKTLVYGTIAFTVAGILASVAYVMIQQLKK